VVNFIGTLEQFMPKFEDSSALPWGIDINYTGGTHFRVPEDYE